MKKPKINPEVVWVDDKMWIFYFFYVGNHTQSVKVRISECK